MYHIRKIPLLTNKQTLEKINGLQVKKEKQPTISKMLISYIKSLEQKNSMKQEQKIMNKSTNKSTVLILNIGKVHKLITSVVKY